MKAKINDYFTKNCKDAANHGYLWYAIDTDRKHIMFSMDNIIVNVVEYDARLHSILEYVHGDVRCYEVMYDKLFYTDDRHVIVEDALFAKATKYRYQEHTYLKIGDDYFFDYDYFKRKLPKDADIVFDVYTVYPKCPIACMIVYENYWPIMAIVNCAYKKVGLYD